MLETLVNKYTHFSELEYSDVQDPDIRQVLECYVNLPDIHLIGECPLNFKNIADKQHTDNKLQILKQRLSNQYVNKSLAANTRDVTCYVK